MALVREWSSQAVLVIAAKWVEVPFECHPAKADTVQKTRTLFTVLKPSRGRKTEIFRARLDQPSFTPPSPPFRVAAELGIASEDSAFVTLRGRLALTCQAEPKSSVDRAGGFRGPPKQRADCSAQNDFYDVSARG